MLREEEKTLRQRHVTDEDRTFIERVIEQAGRALPPVGAVQSAPALPLRQRLAAYWLQLVASWQLSLAQSVKRSGEEMWQWQSDDDHVRARAVMEANADLVLHISSDLMQLEGVRLSLGLGLLTQEITLERVFESEVAASFAIPWQCRMGKLAELSINSL